jgi:hypothetical protein
MNPALFNKSHTKAIEMMPAAAVATATRIPCILVEVAMASTLLCKPESGDGVELRGSSCSMAARNETRISWRSAKEAFRRDLQRLVTLIRAILKRAPDCKEAESRKDPPDGRVRVPIRHLLAAGHTHVFWSADDEISL